MGDVLAGISLVFGASLLVYLLATAESPERRRRRVLGELQHRERYTDQYYRERARQRELCKQHRRQYCDSMDTKTERALCYASTLGECMKYSGNRRRAA